MSLESATSGKNFLICACVRQAQSSAYFLRSSEFERSVWLRGSKYSTFFEDSGSDTRIDHHCIDTILPARKKSQLFKGRGILIHVLAIFPKWSPHEGMHVARCTYLKIVISHQNTSMNVIHSCANFYQVWGMGCIVNNLFLDTFLLIYLHQDTN